jgi:branched-chain amino acid transport system substrate-binding protein
MILSLGIVLLGSCSRPPIKVGVSLVLAGLSSQIGVAGRNGIELAAEGINASGGIRGRRLELLVRDDGDLPDSALAADAALIEQGVVAIIGHMSSRSGAKAIPYASEKKIPLISPTISSTDWSGKDDYFFRPIGTNELQGVALARHAFAAGLRLVAAAYEETNRAYTRNVVDSFASAFASQGGRLLQPISFKGGKTSDHAALARSLIAAKPDAILAVAGSYDEALLCQELAKLGSAVPVYAGMWAMTDDLLNDGGRTIERMRIAGVMDLEDPSPAFQGFRTGYNTRFGHEPDFAAMFAYESMTMLAEALSSSRSLSGPDIKAAILAHHGFAGLLGDLELDASGDCLRPYQVFAPTGGRFVLQR